MPNATAPGFGVELTSVVTPPAPIIGPSCALPPAWAHLEVDSQDGRIHPKDSIIELSGLPISGSQGSSAMLELSGV